MPARHLPVFRRCGLNTEQIALALANLASERKGLAVVAIDLRRYSSYADFLVIASGTSDRHVGAIAEHIEATASKDLGLRAIGVEGLREGTWALVDFGAVVVHVFHEYARTVYDLESMWKDAPRLTLGEDPV